MDLDAIERIVTEEVKKVLAERQRPEEILYPADTNETLDASACQGPSCTMPVEQPNVSAATNQVQPSAASVPTPKPKPPNPDEPAILVLFTGARESWDQLTDAFRSWRESGIRLDAIFSDSARYIIPTDELEQIGFRMVDQPRELYEIMYDMKRYEAVFAPSISRTHAAKLALAITDNVTLNLLLSSLAQNVPTFASDEGLGPTACVVCGNHVPGIQEVLDNYRSHLGTMGLKLMPATDSIRNINEMVLNKVESGPDLITTLITEEDAFKLKGPVIKVSRGGLITPLAMEYLNKQGIEVVIVPQK